MAKQAHDVCPWWIGYLLASPVRRLLQNPDALLSPFVRPGMTVLEPGPGMGFFTIPLARLVGENGCVHALDVQQKMLDGLKRRAQKAELATRIHFRLAKADSMGVEDLCGKVDLVVAIAMVHEVPSPERFFSEAAATLKPNGLLLLAEPSGHVSSLKFAEELDLANKVGLRRSGEPVVRRFRTAILTKSE